MKEFKYKDITEKIIGASMKVHTTLGCGFQEVIYQRALALQMEFEGLAFQREANMPIYYLDIQIGERRVDFFVESKICVELKAVTKLEPVHFAQARNYLEAFNMEVGLLINFGTVSLEYRRLENPKFNPYLITHIKSSPLSQKSI
jgi:GxxExxY protein